MTAMFALLLTLAAAAPETTFVPDPIATALVGLIAVVEEDGAPDRPLVGMTTHGCETKVSAQESDWTIDWRKAEAVALEDTFVFVSAPPVKLAVVADASKPDQADKLRELNRAMQEVAKRCTTSEPGKPLP